MSINAQNTTAPGAVSLPRGSPYQGGGGGSQRRPLRSPPLPTGAPATQGGPGVGNMLLQSLSGIAEGMERKKTEKRREKFITSEREAGEASLAERDEAQQAHEREVATTRFEREKTIKEAIHRSQQKQEAQALALEAKRVEYDELNALMGAYERGELGDAPGLEDAIAGRAGTYLSALLTPQSTWSLFDEETVAADPDIPEELKPAIQELASAPLAVSEARTSTGLMVMTRFEGIQDKKARDRMALNFQQMVQLQDANSEEYVRGLAQHGKHWGYAGGVDLNSPLYITQPGKEGFPSLQKTFKALVEDWISEGETPQDPLAAVFTELFPAGSTGDKYRESMLNPDDTSIPIDMDTAFWMGQWGAALAENALDLRTIVNGSELPADQKKNILGALRYVKRAGLSYAESGRRATDDWKEPLRHLEVPQSLRRMAIAAQRKTLPEAQELTEAAWEKTLGAHAESHGLGIGDALLEAAADEVQNASETQVYMQFPGRLPYRSSAGLPAGPRSYEETYGEYGAAGVAGRGVADAAKAVPYGVEAAARGATGAIGGSALKRVMGYPEDIPELDFEGLTLDEDEEAARDAIAKATMGFLGQ